VDAVYRSVVGFGLGTFRVMRWDMRPTGLRNIPDRGPAIFASNHIGYLDFAFIGEAASRRGRLIRFLARGDAFDHWLGGPLLRAMRHIPVDREGNASAALGAARAAVEAGEAVGIHPEGAMSRSFVPQPGKTGAARLALATGASLVPTAVWGSQRILAPGHPKFPRHVVVTVDFGAPVHPEQGEDAAALTGRLMDAIRVMVQRAAAMYPQRPRGASDGWWLPAHLGGTAPTVEESLASLRAAARRRRARRAPVAAGDAPA